MQKNNKTFFLVIIVTSIQWVVASETMPAQHNALLTAEKLVTDVLLANPQLEVAQAAWEASVSTIKQQTAFDDLLFSYSLAPLTIGNNRTNYGQRIEISQKLPWLGKRYLRGETARYKADAANQTLDGLRLKLSALSKSYFADWYFIHKAIDINQSNLALLKELRELSLSRYSTGLASRQDALRADMEYALLEHQAIILVQQQNSIRTHINTLLNKQPGNALAMPFELIEIEPLPTVDLLHKQAIQFNPELKALEANIKAAKSQSELTLKNNYPDINLKAGYNSLWENSDKHFTIGIGFNLPLFQEKQKAAEAEALAQIKQIEWQKIDLISKLREDIQVKYDQTVESMHVLKLYKHKLLPLAKETLAAAKADYKSGKGDFLSLISSEKNYMQTQLQTEQALANTHRRFAKLKSAVGSFDPLLNQTP